MGTHNWGIIAETVGTVLAPLKGSGGPPFPLGPPIPPPAPPIEPPPPSSGDSTGDAGAASEAAKEAVAVLGKIVNDLAALDASAEASLEAIVAAGEAGKAELDKVEKDIEAKALELGPRLETPEGQKELRDYVEKRLGEARTVINDAMKTADDNSRKTRELIDQYAGVGLDTTGDKPVVTTDNNDDGGGGTDNDGGGTDNNDGGGGGGGTDNNDGGGGGTDNNDGGGGGGSTQPAANPLGTGMPMAGGMPMGMPSMGGGGMPMGGMPSFGDPMSALSDLAGSKESPMALNDDGLGLPDEDGGSKGLELHEEGSDDGSGDDGKGDVGGGTGPAGSADPTGEEGEGGDGPAPEPAKTTEVKLPDGSTVEARSPVGAEAVRSILKGSSVSEGYAQHGVNLPPPGTPVTDPVPPTQLKAGDVGVWKDHMVLALGDKQVLVSGQVQPQESVGSGADFLGWIDPTKLADPSAQA